MIVNSRTLRIRFNDGHVEWLKNGSEIDLNEIPLVMANKLKLTNRVVEKEDAGKQIVGYSDKKMKKASNKKPTKKKEVKK